MNETDELLPTMMRRATERLDQPDAADLVERGLRRGRQLQRRRTVAISVAAASAVVLAATGAFAAGKFLPSQDVQVATSPSAEPSPTAKPSPTDKPTNPPNPEPDPEPETSNPSEAETLAILRAVVPKGFKITDPMTWGGSFAAARITVDDGNGATELNVMVHHVSDEPRCPVEPPASCHRFPDGSVVQTLENMRVYTKGHPSDLGVVNNTATLARPDGLLVSLTNYNAIAEKGKAPTRKQPTFSVDELTEMAQDPRWNVAPPSATGTKLPRR